MIYADKQAKAFLSSTLHTIPEGAVPLHEDEEQSHVIHLQLIDAVNAGHVLDWSGDIPVLGPVQPLSGTQHLQVLQVQASQAFARSDRVVLRCFEHGVAVPAIWVTYRDALRDLLRADAWSDTLELPEQPEYPPGT